MTRLCQARRLIVRASGLPHEHLGDRPAITKREIDAELKRLSHDCAPKQSSATSQTTGPTHLDAGSTPAPIALDEQPAPAAEDELLPLAVMNLTSDRTPNTFGHEQGQRAEQQHAEVQREPVQEPQQRQPAALAPAPARHHDAADLSAAEARPGRGLLIAGGALLGSASLGAGLAAFASFRTDLLVKQQNGLAAMSMNNGYTAPDMTATRNDLEADALRWQRIMVGTSIATGVVGGVAVALLVAGGVKRWPPAERLSIRPAGRGLLFTARF